MSPFEPSPTESAPSSPAGTELNDSSQRPAPVAEPKTSFEDEKASELDLPPRSKVPVRLLTGPSNNFPRTPYILKFLAIIFVANSTLFATFSWWYYKHTKAELIASIASHLTPVTEVSGVEVIESLKNDLTELRKNIQAAQIKNTKSSSDAVTANNPPNTTSQTSLAQSDLNFLKERNRLASYADEAIATGAREPYEKLSQSKTDPSLANAVRSEILRVQDSFLSGQRVKYYGIQQYHIPVAEIFPESAALAPDQLSDDQLIQILQNHAQVWQTRVKAAWHLGQRHTTKSTEALVKAIKEDPALDVMAEATFSFEQITGYHARLFEVQPLLEWWISYNKVPQINPAKVRPQANGDIPAH